MSGIVSIFERGLSKGQEFWNPVPLFNVRTHLTQVIFN